jgi:hypothetical protein
MNTLPNGNPIELDILEAAMEDSDLSNRYYLNLVSGKVVFFSDDLDLSEEDEPLSEEIDESDDYIAVDRIPSHEAYRWMVDFVDEMVTPSEKNGSKRGINGKTSSSKPPSKSGSKTFSSSFFLVGCSRKLLPI